MMNKPKTVNILGTEYEFALDDLNNYDLRDADGVTFMWDKRIIIRHKEYQSGLTEESRQSLPRDAAVIPFPRPETTPPVTNTYLTIAASLSARAVV